MVVVLSRKAGYLKGALEAQPSERQLLAQHAQVESLVKKLSFLIEKATCSLVQNDPEYFKDKNNYFRVWPLQAVWWLAVKLQCSDHLFLNYKHTFCASMMKINLEIESNGFKFSSDLFIGNNFEHTSRVADQKQLLRRVKRREELFAGKNN
ncbi:LOW QUALITY PROTEIN: uncharacterized protein RDI95_004247 [Morus bassanus]